MTFAVRRIPHTGFDTVALASAFNVTAVNDGGADTWQWVLNPDGTIVRNNGGGYSGGDPFIPSVDAFPSSWGAPAAAGEGANWEASLQITSGSRLFSGSGSTNFAVLNLASDGSGGMLLPSGTIAAQTTAWFSLDVARNLVDAQIFSLSGAKQLTLAGTLRIRQKSSLQQISSSFNVDLS